VDLVILLGLMMIYARHAGEAVRCIPTIQNVGIVTELVSGEILKRTVLREEEVVCSVLTCRGCGMVAEYEGTYDKHYITIVNQGA